MVHGSSDRLAYSKCISESHFYSDLQSRSKDPLSTCFKSRLKLFQRKTFSSVHKNGCVERRRPQLCATGIIHGSGAKGLKQKSLCQMQSCDERGRRRRQAREGRDVINSVPQGILRAEQGSQPGENPDNMTIDDIEYIFIDLKETWHPQGLR